MIPFMVWVWPWKNGLLKNLSSNLPYGLHRKHQFSTPCEVFFHIFKREIKISYPFEAIVWSIFEQFAFRDCPGKIRWQKSIPSKPCDRNFMLSAWLQEVNETIGSHLIEKFSTISIAYKSHTVKKFFFSFWLSGYWDFVQPTSLGITFKKSKFHDCITKN